MNYVSPDSTRDDPKQVRQIYVFKLIYIVFLIVNKFLKINE